MIPKRRLGRTEIEISCLGLGSLGILDRYMARWNTDSGVNAAIQVIETSLDQGINLLDTARWYEDSEKRLGYVVKNRREECVLASKTLIRDVSGARREIDHSLEDLSTNYIDIYKIHHVQWEYELNQVLAPGGALEGLQKAKQDGLIGFIGITGHRVELLYQAIATREFDVVEIPYNIVDYQVYQPLIDLANELDVGIITMKAIGAGILGVKAEAALRFAILSPKVDCVVVGMSTIDQVIANSKVALDTENISILDRQNILQELIQQSADYWGVYCEHYNAEACPFNVPISDVLWLERYRHIYKSGHHAKWLYSKLVTKAVYCENCPVFCQLECPNGMSIQKALVDAHHNLNQEVTRREIIQHGGC